MSNYLSCIRGVAMRGPGIFKFTTFYQFASHRKEALTQTLFFNKMGTSPQGGFKSAVSRKSFPMERGVRNKRFNGRSTHQGSGAMGEKGCERNFKRSSFESEQKRLQK